jgi:hypothetical protein
MKSSIFWSITPCSLLKINRYIGRTCRLYLSGSNPIESYIGIMFHVVLYVCETWFLTLKFTYRLFNDAFGSSDYTGCLRSNGKKFKDENYTLV